MRKDTVLINGRDAIIRHRQSQSEDKEQPKLNTIKVMRALEYLLKGDRSSQRKGINTLHAFTTKDGNNTLDDTRVSNAMVELRKVIPKSGLITFRYLDEKLPRYALINEENIISFSDKLLQEIRKKLSLKL
jgi:hypothetical protein